jgi:hypothetical protein
MPWAAKTRPHRALVTLSHETTSGELNPREGRVGGERGLGLSFQTLADREGEATFTPSTISGRPFASPVCRDSSLGRRLRQRAARVRTKGKVARGMKRRDESCERSHRTPTFCRIQPRFSPLPDRRPSATTPTRFSTRHPPRTCQSPARPSGVGRRCRLTSMEVLSHAQPRLLFV